MAIRISKYSITLDVPQRLEVAQGEDREYHLTFSDTDGSRIDFTGGIAFQLNIRDSAGNQLLGRLGAVLGQPNTGTLLFLLGQSDTATAAVQGYIVDVTWTDADGHKTQLLTASDFEVKQGVAEPGDTITSPPAIPLIYGLNWRGAWSSVTVYVLNDAVTYPDPTGGGSALSSFRCLTGNTNVPPVDGGGALSVDWAYIAERGAQGPVTDPIGHLHQFYRVVDLGGGVLAGEWVVLTQDMILAAFAITGLSGGGVVEVGAAIVHPAFVAAYNRGATVVTMNDGSGALPVTLPATSMAFDAGGSGLPARSYQSNTINDTQSFTLQATDGGATDSRSVGYSYQARARYDTQVPPGSLDAAFIASLAHSFLAPSAAAAISFPAGGGTGYMFYALASVLGAPTTFRDADSGFAVSFSRVAAGVSITNGNGVVMNIDIYRSDFPITAGANIDVS